MTWRPSFRREFHWAWDNDTDIDTANQASMPRRIQRGATPIEKALAAQYAAA